MEEDDFQEFLFVGEEKERKQKETERGMEWGR